MILSITQKIPHSVIQMMTWKKYHDFRKNLNRPKDVQLNILSELIGDSDYSKFIEKYPLVTYANIKESIELSKKTNPKEHYVPTSGSGDEIKWIPYTKKLKKELWNASSVWIHDIYNRHSSIKNGTHYWSLSWLPMEMRTKIHNDDLDFFVGLEKKILKLTMTVGSEVLETPTLHDSLKLTLLKLVNRDVTLISVWSPTFLLELIEKLFNEKEFFLKNIKAEKKKRELVSHHGWSPDLAKILFPRLKVISCWATSSSKQYASRLKVIFPHIQFENKGLWATEGVVTFPFRGHFPLAINSHFYEFKCLKSGKIFPSWDLKIGMEVSPILTTGSSLFRYEINDKLLVTEFLGKTPCFEFQGRLNSTDIVGEKVSSEFAVQMIEKIEEKFSCTPVCLMAMETEKPHYLMMIEGNDKDDIEEEISDFLEENLNLHFHYKLARELGQLMKARVTFGIDTHQQYIKIKERAGMLKGNIKIEPLILCKDNNER